MLQDRKPIGPIGGLVRQMNRIAGESSFMLVAFSTVWFQDKLISAKKYVRHEYYSHDLFCLIFAAFTYNNGLLSAGETTVIEQHM